jgi:hypothetical protein
VLEFFNPALVLFGKYSANPAEYFPLYTSIAEISFYQQYAPKAN